MEQIEAGALHEMMDNPRADAQACLAIAGGDGAGDEVRLSAAELLSDTVARLPAA
jgi:hypothetical protein